MLVTFCCVFWHFFLQCSLEIFYFPIFKAQKEFQCCVLQHQHKVFALHFYKCQKYWPLCESIIALRFFQYESGSSLSRWLSIFVLWIQPAPVTVLLMWNGHGHSWADKLRYLIWVFWLWFWWMFCRGLTTGIFKGTIKSIKLYLL